MRIFMGVIVGMVGFGALLGSAYLEDGWSGVKRLVTIFGFVVGLTGFFVGGALIVNAVEKKT